MACCNPAAILMGNKNPGGRASESIIWACWLMLGCRYGWRPWRSRLQQRMVLLPSLSLSVRFFSKTWFPHHLRGCWQFMAKIPLRNRWRPGIPSLYTTHMSNTAISVRGIWHKCLIAEISAGSGRVQASNRECIPFAKMVAVLRLSSFPSFHNVILHTLFHDQEWLHILAGKGTPMPPRRGL